MQSWMKWVLLGALCCVSFFSAAFAGLTPQRLQDDPARYVSVTTILGQTDVAPDYQPEPIVWEQRHPYMHMPYHVQQNHDFQAGFATQTLPQPHYTPLLPSRTVVTFSLGSGWPSQQGDLQSFNALGNTVVYQAAQAHDVHAVIGASIAQEYWHSQHVGVQLGIAYYQPTHAYAIAAAAVQGPLQAGQFNYQYRIRARQLLFELKLLTKWYQRFYPYLSVGVGEAFNSVSGFSTSNPALAATTPQFTATSNRSFAYRFGFGLEMEWLPNLRIGLGYRFVNWGCADLGPAVMNTTPIGAVLRQSHFYTNELVAQLTYLF